MHTCIVLFEALSLVEARLKQVYSQLKRPVTIVQSHGSANRMQPQCITACSLVAAINKPVEAAQATQRAVQKALDLPGSALWAR